MPQLTTVGFLSATGNEPSASTQRYAAPAHLPPRLTTRKRRDVRIGSRNVRVTNLEKVLFPGPGLTKGDLIHYYQHMAPHLLPHVRKRPMQMLRYPDGVEGFGFCQKRVPSARG
jgi:hypothetical protein